MFLNDRKLYNELYGAENRRIANPDFLGDEEIEFPETEAEFKSMVASMMRHGALPRSDVTQEDQNG